MRPDSLPRLRRYINLLLTYLLCSCTHMATVGVKGLKYKICYFVPLQTVGTLRDLCRQGRVVTI